MFRHARVDHSSLKERLQRPAAERPTLVVVVVAVVLLSLLAAVSAAATCGHLPHDMLLSSRAFPFDRKFTNSNTRKSLGTQAHTHYFKCVVHDFRCSICMRKATL